MYKILNFPAILFLITPTEIDRHQCYDEPVALASERKRATGRSNEENKT